MPDASNDSSLGGELVSLLSSTKKPWQSKTVVLGVLGLLASVIPGVSDWVKAHPDNATAVGSALLVLIRIFVGGDIALSDSPLGTTATPATPAVPATSAPGSGGPGAGALMLLLCMTLGAVVAGGSLVSCSTQARVDAANIIDSPATQEIVKIALAAGESDLLAKTGNGMPSAAKTALTSALTDLANTAATSTLSGIAGALAGEGGTAAAADSGQLIAAQTAATNVPVTTALKVALVPSAIVNSSNGAITPANANAALVAAVKSVAAQLSASGK